VPFRRLDDHIRELCRQVAASDDTNFAGVLYELRSALREHVQHLRNLAIQQLAEEKEHKSPSLGE
jgi:hypothetical protein